MTFEKYAPDPELSPWVESILIVRSPEGMVNTLAPNSAPVLTFRLEGTTTELRSGEKPIPRLAVTGLIHSPRTIRYHPHSAMLLVRFREGVASGLVAPPLDELSGTSWNLDALIAPGVAHEVEDRLDGAPDDACRVAVLQGFLKANLSRPLDPLVAETISRIRQARGNLRMDDLVRGLPTNPDTLEKRFRRLVGTTPKKFSRVVRFQGFLDGYAPGSSLTEAALRAGFYDQAHLVKEFQAFTGESPSAYLSRPRHW